MKGRLSSGDPARALETRRVPLQSLRPTQVAVGMRAVLYKRRKLEKRIKRKEIGEYIANRFVPTVRGPGKQLYIIDNHHFCLALWQVEIDVVHARILADLSHLRPGAFWSRMEAQGRLYPYDEQGRRVAPENLPKWVDSLRHDPFRDLAWEIREAGGYCKASTPYSEFMWANYFRRHIGIDCLRADRQEAFAKALRLCRKSSAAFLPGFIARSKWDLIAATRQQASGFRAAA